MALELGGSRAIRISDLHLPDILPVLRLPVISSHPPRSSDEDKVAESHEIPGDATVENVIKLLKITDVTKLRPLQDSKSQPDDLTPLLSHFQTTSPGLFSLRRDETNLRRKSQSTAKYQSPSLHQRQQISPISFATPQSNQQRNTNTPSSSSSSQHAKRERASIKINVIGEQTPTIAPTAAEHAQSMADTLISTLTTYCNRYKDLLKSSIPDDEMEEEEEEIDKVKDDDNNDDNNNNNDDDINAQQLDTDDIDIIIDNNDEKQSTKHTATSASSTMIRRLTDIRSLSDTLVASSETIAIMQRIPRDLLMRTLSTLRALIDTKRHTLVEEGDGENDAHILGVLGCLEAAGAVLRISTAAYHGEVFVVSEEAIEASIEAARYQIQHNILPFYDARLRSSTRPALGKRDGNDPGKGDGQGTSIDDEGKHGGPSSKAGLHPSKKRKGNLKTSSTGTGTGTGGKRGGRGSTTTHPTNTTTTTTTTTTSMKSTAQLKLEIAPALSPIIDRIQSILSLLCDFLPRVKVPTSMLVPLLRSLTMTLSLSSLPSLQSKAASVIAAAFCGHPDIQKSIFDDIFAHAIPYLGTGKHIKREYSLSESGSNPRAINGTAAKSTFLYALPTSSTTGSQCIQVVSACILQSIQGCVELPQVDDSSGAVIQSYGPAVKAADYFWALSLDKLETARSHKAESDINFTAIFSSIVQDFLSALYLPQWPAASTLILRLAAAINSPRGLQHHDAIMRQVSIDLLGKVLTILHQGEAIMREEESWLLELVQESGFNDDLCLGAQDLVLKYLADNQRSLTPTAISARTFWLVRSLSVAAAALQAENLQNEEMGLKTPPSTKNKGKKKRTSTATTITRDNNDEDRTNNDNNDDNNVGTLLTKARQKSKELSTLTFNTGIDPGTAIQLMHPLIQAEFIRALPAMLSWLVEMLDVQHQAPTTRAKVIKALSDVASVDPVVLDITAVQAAIERSLHDESVSVREAALSLLGKHMVGNPELALRLLDVVLLAVDDAGASVRKCAIKILRDAAIAVPGFPRHADACCAVMARAVDHEESVQSMVAKVFHGLWFSPQMDVEIINNNISGLSSSTSPCLTTVRRSAAERAQQLAEVAMASYEAGGAAIHLPLDSQHSLVVVLRSALGWDARGDLHVEWKTGREITLALLDSIVAPTTATTTTTTPSAAINDATITATTTTTPVATTTRTSSMNTNDDDEQLPALLALHALAITDAALCVPDGDPLKFLRALAPHLKVGGSSETSAQSTENDRRCAAERLLCVLSIVECVVSQVDHVNDTMGTLGEVPIDLVNLINQHRYTQVVSAACKCLSILAMRSASAANRLKSVAAVYYSWLQRPDAQNPANLPRFLFIMGQLCRYGSSLLEISVPSAAPAISLDSCMKIFTRFWQYKGHASTNTTTTTTPLSSSAARERMMQAQIRRCALEAMGQLAIAKPSILVIGGNVDGNPNHHQKNKDEHTTSIEAKNMITSALQIDALPEYKLAALGSLTELLQADAEGLEMRQKIQGGGGGNGTAATASMHSSAMAITSVAAKKKSSLKRKKTKKQQGKSTAKKRKTGKKGLTKDDDDEETESEEEEEDNDNDDNNDMNSLSKMKTTRVSAVATENGEGNALSQSSAVLQQHWEAVLRLATENHHHTTTSNTTTTTINSAAAQESATNIRRRVLALMDIVIRDGLVGPWTAVPTLMALCSDTAADVRSRALRLLCQLSEKHAQYVDAGRLTAGIEEAAKLYFNSTSGGIPSGTDAGGRSRGATATGEPQPPLQIGSPSPVPPPPLVSLAGIGAVYSNIVWPLRTRRNEFLRLMLRYFRSALGPQRAIASPSAVPVPAVLAVPAVPSGRTMSLDGPPSLNLLVYVATVVSALPMRRGEEPCVLIQECDSLIRAHADAVLVELQAYCMRQNDDDDRSDGNESTAKVKPTVNSDDDAHDASLKATCEAASALCMLHRLRVYLQKGYSISAERYAAFASAGGVKRKSGEDSAVVVFDGEKAGGLSFTDLLVVNGGSVDMGKVKRLYEELENAHVKDGDDDDDDDYML